MKIIEKVFAWMLALSMVLGVFAAFPLTSLANEAPQNPFTLARPGNYNAVCRPSGISRAEIIAYLEELLPNHEPRGQAVVGNMPVTPNIMAGWDSSRANETIRSLIFGGPSAGGLVTVIYTAYLEAFPNPMVVREIESADNADGSRTHTFTIYTANRFSDGTLITAEHYAGGIALFSSPEWAAIADFAPDYSFLAGFEEWRAGTAPMFEGVRLLSDEQFSVTVRADQLPQVFETELHMLYGPAALHTLLPPDIRAVDGGAGVHFPGLTKEALSAVINGTLFQILDDDGKTLHISGTGERFAPAVSSGPYRFVSYDHTSRTAVLEANPYFPGTWCGALPSIKTLVFTDRPDDEEYLATAVRFPDDDGARHVLPYERNGYEMIRFHADHGPTQFVEVRQAVKWLLDRDELARAFNGTVVQGAYSTSQWFYREALDRGFCDRIIQYTYDPQMAVWALEEGGWVLNGSGGPFALGTDDVRYKDVDGELMRLSIHWAVADLGNNPVADLIYATLPDEAAAIGMELVVHRVDNAFELSRRAGGSPPMFHMFSMDKEFAVPHQPWDAFRYQPEYLGSQNTNFVTCPNLFHMADYLRLLSLETEEGRSKFVDAWLDLQIELNRLVLDIPLFAGIYHDLVPDGIRGWFNHSAWGAAAALVRAWTE